MKKSRVLGALCVCISALLTSIVSENSFAASISLSQTIEFLQIEARQGPGNGTEGTFVLPAWSQIDRITFGFTSTDPDFNNGVGPGGGDSGVEIGFMNDDAPPVRDGIASVHTGNQVFSLFPGSSDPQRRFELVSSLLLDGELTVSLSSFENFPDCCSFGFLLDEPSSLTLTVRGAVVPIPPAVWLFGSGLLGLIGIARRKAA